MWRQDSESEESDALFLLPCVLLLWIFSTPPHVQVLHSVVRLAKVGCNWFLFVFFSSFLCWSGVYSSSHVGHSLSLRHSAGSTSCMIGFFVLHEMLLRMWYFIRLIWLSNVLLVTISWQHLHRLLLHLLLHLLLPVVVEGAIDSSLPFCI